MMTVPPPAPDLDALLAHSGWVRALARNLVVDPFAAEDTEQQAWVTALEHPPSHGGNLRAWWGAVVRSSAGQGWREQKRRREVSLGQKLDDAASGAATAAEVAEKLDTFQHLALAVAQLPEPYRSVIYLRYFEELSVRALAKRQGVPLATAQSHIHRGLEKLRVTLAENVGAQWRSRCLVFALPLPAAPWLPLAPAAILAMKTKTILGVAAGLLALISIGVWQPWVPQEVANHDFVADADLPHPASTPSPLHPENAALEGQAANPVIRRLTQTPVANPASEGDFEVLVRNARTLEPMPGAIVHLLDYALRDQGQNRVRREECLANITAVQRFGVEYQANEFGLATIPKPAGRHELAAQSGEYYGYHWSFDKPPFGERVELMLMPEVQLRVEVKDSSGNPVAGVKVGFEAVPMQHAGFASREVTTNSEGTGIFRHLEFQVSEHPEWMCTFALLVPSAAPQVKELRGDAIHNSVLQFTMPATGTVLVHAQQADGTPLENGTPIVLQVANDIAREVAKGQQRANPEQRFEPSLKDGVAIAYVRDGVATFPQVGVATELVAASYDRANLGYSLSIAHGPTLVGEQVAIHLSLQEDLPTLHLRLVDGSGNPVEAGRMTSLLSGVNSAGNNFGYGFELAVEEGGIAAIKMRQEALIAERLLVSTDSRADAFNGKGVSRLELGILFIQDDFAQQMDKVWDIPHAPELLLAGQIVDQAGAACPEYKLKLWLVEDSNPAETRLMDSWDFQTDAAGRFEIHAPRVVAGMSYSLNARSDDHSFLSAGGDLQFTPGDHGKVFTVNQPQYFAGRLLVDDPKQLRQLELSLVEGVPGAAGSRWYPLEIDSMNGRFRTRPAEDKQYTLWLRGKDTLEELGRLSNLQSMAITDADTMQLPDWDLRGKLFPHHVAVTTSSGHSIAEISLRLSHEKDDLTAFVPPDFEFLTTQAVQPITVGAAGYRNEEVIISRALDVSLFDGFSVTVNFAEDLPSVEGLQWRATLVEVRTPGQSGGISWERLLWQNLTGNQAQLRVPSYGTWALLLRAAPTIGFDDNNFLGMYGTQNDVISVQVDDSDTQINTRLKEEELERMMAEVLAPEK
jgi:RNA polymerase sigma factor (sigma-70 family)